MSGKYDAFTNLLASTIGADAVLTCVLGGELGGGCSVCATHPEQWLALADKLDQVAAALRKDYEQWKGPRQ